MLVSGWERASSCERRAALAVMGGGVFQTGFLRWVCGLEAPGLTLAALGYLWKRHTDAAHTPRSHTHQPFFFFPHTLTVCPLPRNEDLKEMLESNKESLKLEAMKRVVGVRAQPPPPPHSPRLSGPSPQQRVD